MKILHTADLQLGMPFRHLGPFGERVRQAQLETLERILEVGREERVGALLIAGDLFHSNQPSSRLVERVLRLLRWVKYPIVLLPGNHDHAGPGSVYHRPAFQRLPEHVHLFRSWEPQTVRVAGLTVHGRAAEQRKAPLHPLEGLRPDPDSELNVAMAHGAMRVPDRHDPGEFVITREEIGASGMDYVALGHWHPCSEWSEGGVTAWYSGTPETTDFEEGDRSGFVLLVELEHGRPAQMERRRVGRFLWKQLSLDVAQHPPGEALLEHLRSQGGAEVVARVSLDGLMPAGQALQPETVQEELAEAFAHLEVTAGQLAVSQASVEELFPAGTIGAAFVSLAQARIREAAGEEERARWEDALRTGAAYLSGELSP